MTLRDSSKKLFSKDLVEEWLTINSEKLPAVPQEIEINENALNAVEYTAPSHKIKGREKFDYNWLLSHCVQVQSALPNEELIVQILETLKGSQEIESALLDLLGFDNFEFIGLLVQNKDAIISDAKGRELEKIDDTLVFRKERPNTPGQSIRINTTSAKKQQKQYRKVNRGHHISLDGNPASSQEKSIKKLDADLRKILQVDSARVQLPNVFLPPKTGSELVKAGNFAMPPGTLHHDQREWEEFQIPFSKEGKKLTDSIESIRIKDLPPFLQKAFPGYTKLNKMQSALYDTVMGTNENILVCAPTGAGKTDVAMLSVLKCIIDHTNGDGKIDKDSFKIVYVAPMKALASEIASKFSKRLTPFGLKVREYTGDMQLSRQEIVNTQMIIATPEKWDVITRKGAGDVDLIPKVRLLLIDEVHLLQDDRGAVIETIVARTLRFQEISQCLVRIVGLSATLPNYVDVAVFLGVDVHIGLFVFGDAFRPVPLTQQFVGIKGKSRRVVMDSTNQACYKKCIDFLKDGHQVMIFVHSRLETVKSAKTMITMATEDGQSAALLPPPQQQLSQTYRRHKKSVGLSKNRELSQTFKHGAGFHHAGMLRSDRTLVEKMFEEGSIRLLCCTSTLAWGVNLPAHTVIIKGTLVYDQQRADFVNLGVLDVLQIFGRAGRPQYESHGEGIIITTHDQLARYINAIMSQVPIESRFIEHLPDNLNAEISLGTVGSLDEAVAWLKYSYLWVRMKRNPLAYGIQPKELIDDPEMWKHLQGLCKSSLRRLASCGMISLQNVGGMADDNESNVIQTPQEEIIKSRNVGRIASDFYLSLSTIEVWTKGIRAGMSEDALLALVASATEFIQFRVREEELDELDHLRGESPIRIIHDTATAAGKASLLIIAHISRYQMDTFSLSSDAIYVGQNAGRLFSALFELLRMQGWHKCAYRCLMLNKAFSQRTWPLHHPLLQFPLKPEISRALKDTANTNISHNLDTLLQMDAHEISKRLNINKSNALHLQKCINSFPRIALTASLQPTSSNILTCYIKMTLLCPASSSSMCPGSQLWWLWIYNDCSGDGTGGGDSGNIHLHCEDVFLNSERSLTIHIPFTAASTSVNHKISIKVVNAGWLHAEAMIELPIPSFPASLQNNPDSQYTDLLNLTPLPKSALCDAQLEQLYSFDHFNAVQTQTFHNLYHHHHKSIVIGAPTGSGKTVLAELAIWRALRLRVAKPSHGRPSLIVYVAPLKALLKERARDWNQRFSPLGIKCCEVSGDTAIGLAEMKRHHIILTTPEKWDSLSRKAANQIECSLIIFDEIHLLGSDRGHVIEMIVTRLKQQRKLQRGQEKEEKEIENHTRIIGLSTALADSQELSNWLEIPSDCIYNFRPSVRPVPLQVRIEGFTHRHYCPRMALMNKPIYVAIKRFSPHKPTLIFVSSRRQCRLTSNALISLASNELLPRRFVAMDEKDLAKVCASVQDETLCHSLSFGIALHHAGLSDADRGAGEELFAAGKVQVMIATSTLAWGLNFPVHLVIVKGSEYFDAKIGGYSPYPLTDVLQMIGRAGRPQFDSSAHAVILCKQGKKAFFKRFLYASFPLESSLMRDDLFADHLMAEIVGGRVIDFEGAKELFEATFCAQRLKRNPAFYGTNLQDLEEFKDAFIRKQSNLLICARCIDQTQGSIQQKLFSATPLAYICTKYYISHKTGHLFASKLLSDLSLANLLLLLCMATEFDDTPLRHNEDGELRVWCSSQARFKDYLPPSPDWKDAHTKVFVLLVALCEDMSLPFTDFALDLHTILEQFTRIMMAMLQIILLTHRLEPMKTMILLMQKIEQGRRKAKSNEIRRAGDFDANLKVSGKQSDQIKISVNINGGDWILLVVEGDRVLESHLIHRSLYNLILYKSNLPINSKILLFSLQQQDRDQIYLLSTLLREKK